MEPHRTLRNVEEEIREKGTEGIRLDSRGVSWNGIENQGNQGKGKERSKVMKSDSHESVECHRTR